MNDAGPSMEEPAEGVSAIGIAPPAYRLPADTRLGHVTLQVGDLGRSLEYYGEVLGLREISTVGDTVNLGAPDGVPLVALREHSGAVPVPRGGRLGLYHFALLLPDRPALGAFLSHLAQRGIKPGMSDHSVSEAIYLSDPDGLGIEVYADRPRSEWRHRGRELHMTTEPLDVAGLLADAAAWSGMPAGSVIGHVHLFVGSLEQSDAFYHTAVGLDRMVWSYPGASFLAAGGYHHHLGTNTWARDAAPAGGQDARLLEWRLVLPAADAVRAAGKSLEDEGFPVDREGDSCIVADPWGTRLRLLAHDRA